MILFVKLIYTKHYVYWILL